MCYFVFPSQPLISKLACHEDSDLWGCVGLYNMEVLLLFSFQKGTLVLRSFNTKIKKRIKEGKKKKKAKLYFTSKLTPSLYTSKTNCSIFWGSKQRLKLGDMF